MRALQRLGSGFENLSAQERSCILSGQHQGGHCTCRIAAREANSNDDANARASISRIVMLAEALFEVMQQILRYMMAMHMSFSLLKWGESFAIILIRFWMKFTSNLLSCLLGLLFLPLDLFQHLLKWWTPCL